jgi:hypothetical protein
VGTALLLLDGLDEISDPTARTKLCRQLERVNIAYPQAPIITTSRVVGYRELGYRIGRGFEHAAMADLSAEDKNDFASRWCAITELPERRESAIAELKADIHSTPRIEALTGNPMMITTMALVKRKVGKLPSRRADLYWEAVQVLLNWRREVDLPLDQREAMPQLEYVAYAMCDRGVQRLREDEVIDLLHEMRAEYPQIHAARARTPEEFLAELESRTGLVAQTGEVRHLGRPVPVYEFRHLTFQEYLAARALVEGHFPGRDPSSSLAESVAPLAGHVGATPTGSAAVVESWREPIRLCVASCNDSDVDDVLRAVLTMLPGDDRDLARPARALLAGQCLTDEPNASDGVATEIMRTLLAVGSLSYGTPSREAIAELAVSRWRAALLSAIQCQCTGDWQRDVDLSYVATQPGYPRGPLDTDSARDLLRKGAAAMAAEDLITRLDGAATVLSLAFVQLDTDSGRRTGYLEFALFAGAGVLPMLVAGLDGPRPLPLVSAWALGWVYDGRRQGVKRPPRDLLDSHLARIENGRTDPAVVRFLLWLFAVPEDLGPDLEERLKAIVPAWICQAPPEAGAGALQSFGDSVRPWLAEVLPELASICATEVRIAIATLLGSGDIHGQMSLLMKLATGSDLNVRAEALKSTGRVARRDKLTPELEPAVLDLARQALDHEHSGLASAAVASAAVFNDQSAIMRLTRGFASPDPDVRVDAMAKLVKAWIDDIDCRILTDDIDGMGPYRDPAVPVDLAVVAKAAARLGISKDEVVVRFEWLADRFGLRLAWREEPIAGTPES